MRVYILVRCVGVALNEGRRTEKHNFNNKTKTKRFVFLLFVQRLNRRKEIDFQSSLLERVSQRIQIETSLHFQYTNSTKELHITVPSVKVCTFRGIILPLIQRIKTSHNPLFLHLIYISPAWKMPICRLYLYLIPSHNTANYLHGVQQIVILIRRQAMTSVIVGYNTK
jgi:hypothetical protein